MSVKIEVVPGKRFGKLVAIKEVAISEDHHTMCLFKCDCGNERIIKYSRVNPGNSEHKLTSCGCVWKNKVKLTNNPLYSVWKGMIGRCYNKKSKSYDRYGKKGITVCDEWKDAKGLINFIAWAESNGYAKGLQIDKDTLSKEKLIYSPSTCQFVTISNNNAYRSKAKNKSSKYLGVSYYYKGKGTESVNPWKVNIMKDGKKLVCKRFGDELEAAQYRDNYIKEHRLHHKLNFPK